MIKTQLPYYRDDDGTFSVANNAYFMIKSIKTLGLLFIDTGDTLTNKGISVASNKKEIETVVVNNSTNISKTKNHLKS